MSCLEMISGDNVKSKYLSAIEPIEKAVQKYEESASQRSLHILVAREFRPEERGLGVTLEVTTRDLSEGLYKQRMADRGSSGRRIYDEIKLGAPNGICPLCGIREVSTLDHHLPRRGFPALSVAPLNLVPACTDCNKIKLDKFPATAGDQTLNPYFEDVAQDRWLRCHITSSIPTITSYAVEAPSGWSSDLTSRAHYHFQTFRLGELYSFQANSELFSVQKLHEGMFEALGELGLRSHLLKVAESAHDKNVNSWKGAMYEALAASDWYCTGKFSSKTSGAAD
ncbi:HNH endonuclease [Nonomuraea mangrovi]|uniref:HNH endonuclease n=1 Tax=Nonomuraea mangrovi TaxID=2316207 RepID=A0ABW4T3Y1_9ACTN